MAIKNPKTGTVHAQDFTMRRFFPRCGIWTWDGFVHVKRKVTCKNCLRLMKKT